MSAFRPTPYSGPPPSQAPPVQSVSDHFPSTRPVASSAAPAQGYAALCKVVLSRRTRNNLMLTAAATYVALLVAVFDPRKLPGSLLNFLPVLLFAPIAFLGTLPLFVLRKQRVTTARPPLPTRFAQLAQLNDHSSAQIFFTHLAGAALFHAAYVWCSGYASKDPQLGLFFFHEGRDAWQLNERRVLLGLLHCFVAAFATVQYVLEDRSQVHFEEDISLTIPARLAAKAKVRLRAAVRSTGLAVAFFWSAYVVTRRPVLRFVLVNFAGSWARPHLYSMMRHNGAYSVTLAARALSSSLLHFLAWEAAHVCFEVYATQPMSVSQFSPNPNQCLLSGLRSSEPYYQVDLSRPATRRRGHSLTGSLHSLQQFAYLELAILTLTDSTRRQAIFKDVKPGSSIRGAWSEISRECLLVIGTELQRAKGRGKSPCELVLSSSSNRRAHSDPIRRAASSAGPYPSPVSQTMEQQSSANRVPVKTGNVFVPTKSGLFDKLATAAVSSAPSPAAQKVTSAVSSAVASTQSAISARVPSILQSGGASSSSGPNGSQAPAAPAMHPEDVPQVLGVEQRLATWVPAARRAKVFAVVPEYKVGSCVPRRRETVCAIQALANLTCASLHEDPYGVAQRDIPKILEAFVRYLAVLEVLQGELGALAEKHGREEGSEVGQRWRGLVEKEVGGVQEGPSLSLLPFGVLATGAPIVKSAETDPSSTTALRQGAKAILTEFAPYLSEFRTYLLCTVRPPSPLGLTDQCFGWRAGFPTAIAAQLQVLVDWGG
ncbi:SPOSA6832_01337 [Sporobolomyces salmonicolor]|uniref:SPOSA6832_01337-mRNA-1:cds n=1 Tax=Sporidiobolus salmonicolor TaxID=5005 RepID=A0A0D6EJK0_SPOSA|nr:SPOSA6832_01337 [Sporobolomyces salmonicolor]